MALGGFRNLLDRDVAVTELYSLIAVALDGLLLHHDAGASLDDGDRHNLAVLIEELGHAQLLADNTFLHL